MANSEATPNSALAMAIVPNGSNAELGVNNDVQTFVAHFTPSLLAQDQKAFEEGVRKGAESLVQRTHKASKQSGGLSYQELLSGVLGEDEQAVTFLPFLKCHVASYRNKEIIKEFPYQGRALLTSRRLLVLAANPTEERVVDWQRPQGGPQSNNPEDVHQIGLTYKVSDTTLYWSAPLSAFQEGVEMRWEIGVASSSQIISEADHSICCKRRRQYLEAGSRTQEKHVRRLLELPLKMPPTDEQAISRIFIAEVDMVESRAIDVKDVLSWLKSFHEKTTSR